MADSEKGASTTPANPKEKSPLLDEDIGNDFLSSWKSKDDAMDFSFEPISKGNKKSTMSFESLDMDFNLDAGFGKLSSFKADMSDLDFSSPPNKSSKPKERSEEKISTGNRHGKEEDPLNFNFDFDGLDSFDFGPSLKKGETKSTKKIDGKEVASEARESQVSKVNLTKGFDAFDDDTAMERPVSETIATQKVKTTASDVGDFNSMNEDCPTKSATFRTSAESNVEQTSPGTTKESGQEKHLLEEEMFTEPSTERVIEDLSVQSADEKDTVTNSILEQQMGSSSIGRSDDAGGLKNGHDNMDTKENLNHDNLQCKDLPLSITASEKDSGERNKSSIDPSQENMGRTVKSHDDLDVEASVSNVKTPNSSGPTIMNSKVVVPRIESLRNTRIVSAEGNKLSSLKDGLKKPDSPILKSSRTTGANNDAPGATLQRQTSALRNTTKNMEALRNTTKNMEALRNSAPKISHPAEIIGKKTPQTPSLKRKSFEMSNARDSAPLKPLKRLSESPIETRNVKEHSKDTLDKLGCIRQTKTNTTEHLKSVPEVPRDVNMKEPEILLSMEDNGNVEKAEAYAKDLDDICIMLRKKQEEAKELLLRAIVNNNNLLMLYHPIHEEKIRRAQDFAAKLMSKLTISEA